MSVAKELIHNESQTYIRISRFKGHLVVRRYSHVEASETFRSVAILYQNNGRHLYVTIRRIWNKYIRN